MERAVAKAAFDKQCHGAKRRGIEWELTFEQWLTWWGSDLAKRGDGPDDLQMCRHGDEGPYALGNVYKATKRQNAKTAAILKANRASQRRREDHKARMDAMMHAPSAPDQEQIGDQEFEVLRATGGVRSSSLGKFAADKRR